MVGKEGWADAPDMLCHHRINRVLNFASDRCGDEITLDRLADVACLSKFHFLRLFKSTLCETPFGFLQRIRLERAARNLVYLRSKSISEVGMDCGFGSPQAFSTAFHQRFGVAPRQYRNANVYQFDSYWHGADPDELRHLRRPDQGYKAYVASVPVAITNFRPSKVCYLRRLGSYNDSASICEVFKRMRQWAKPRGLLQDNAELVGIPWDNPNVTPPAHCRYDVCLKLPDDVVVDDNIGIQEIPGGLYAVVLVDREIMDVRHTWEVFLKYWLPESGYAADFRAGYEISRRNPDGCGYDCSEIRIPVHRPYHLS